MSNNGQDYYQRYDYPLIYYNGILAESINPNKVLIGGQTEVLIKGVDFIQDTRIKNALKINGVVVDTTVVNGETITCTLPSFDYLTTETVFDVFVTVNLQDYYTGLTVTYILPPIISSFDPTFSNTHEQYFTVNVTGENFLHSSGLECNLGGYSSYTISFSSSESILWFFSTLPSGLYELKVSNNFGYDYTVSTSKFEVIRSLQVISVYPRVVTSKGTVIFLKGSGFRSGVKWLFEIDEAGYTFNSNMIMNAQILNANLIVCKMPDLSFVGSTNIIVKASFK